MTIRILAICVLVACTSAARAKDDPGLQAQLEEILALDQRYRGSNRPQRWAEVADEQAAIDRTNLAKVEELVRISGWPRRSEVGEDAAMAAFLVIQHADLATQERYLPILRMRVAEGEAKGAWLALLTDRILVGKGKPQLYGTQFRADPATGRSEPLQIEDAQHVNERRAALGMKPMKEVPDAEESD